MMVAEERIVNSRYVYIHETGKWPTQAVDIHHVVARKNGLWSRVACFSVLVLLLGALYLCLGEDLSVSILLMSLVMGASFVKLLRQKLVEKESIVIIPAFGVQLETHYRSGRSVRRFVPIDKILKPVLNECVTPVTCYWSLALILREEDELMLVFKESRPPLKMLLPVWKAISAGNDSGEISESDIFADTS